MSEAVLNLDVSINDLISLTSGDNVSPQHYGVKGGALNMQTVSFPMGHTPKSNGFMESYSTTQKRDNERLILCVTGTGGNRD